ncbi:unnamed protein product [Calypogeia fissa]
MERNREDGQLLRLNFRCGTWMLTTKAATTTTPTTTNCRLSAHIRQLNKEKDHYCTSATAIAETESAQMDQVARTYHHRKRRRRRLDPLGELPEWIASSSEKESCSTLSHTREGLAKGFREKSELHAVKSVRCTEVMKRSPWGYLKSIVAVYRRFVC